MANSVNTNIMSLNAQRNLYTSSMSQATTIQRLSSGLRVNSAKDDAAGLAIAERMNAQIRGNNVAIRNANDGISLAQTAEGALGKIGDSLQRMRELAVQSANATNSSDDRTNLQSEFKQLQDEITRVVGGTTFNGTSLFTGSTSFSFQVGAGTTSNDVVSVARNQLSGGTAGTSGGITSSAAADVAVATVTTASAITGSDATKSTNAIKDIDVALDKLNAERATYGAAQNRFESVIGNLQITVENTSAARSRIMDTDFAAETAALTRSQILTQAGTAMLAQANQAPQSVLSLLR
ncbi:flagellin [Thermomonas paludicola]|uniref:flagellin N-terminal helical domain-containing protein n=1 Tax=Thermomonas paludicola TaxID=2884874 RepID=UPI00211547B3|nr:flagellin [Thermomonas paludicola]